MHKRRVLSYKYFTLNLFLQGCTQCQEFDFFIGPKDTVHPVMPWLQFSRQKGIYFISISAVQVNKIFLGRYCIIESQLSFREIHHLVGYGLKRPGIILFFDREIAVIAVLRITLLFLFLLSLGDKVSICLIFRIALDIHMHKISTCINFPFALNFVLH